MGTIYRTDCGCIASEPDPDPAEYQGDDFHTAYTVWADNWKAIAYAHTRLCPKSAHFTGTLSDPRD